MDISYFFRIYVPERPLSPSMGRKTIARDPYTLNSQTDFDTMINTSVNKYTGLPHMNGVSNSVTTTHCSSATANRTIICGNTETAAMEMTVGTGGIADQSAYKNWSTETTRVFGTGNTSRIDSTFVTGTEAVRNSNHQSSSQHLASQLHSALNTVAMVERQTRIFSADEDTADMEFTACLTSNLGPLKLSQPAGDNVTSPPVSSTGPRDVTKYFDADMEFTLCNISIKNQAADIETRASPSAKVDSQAFVKKLTSRNNLLSQNETKQNNIKNTEETVNEKKGNTSSFKIDAQAFLSKLMTSAPAETKILSQNVDAPSRERTTTEGSEDMEFTACINQIGNGISPVSEAALLPEEKTRICEPDQENMEFTTCLDQTTKDVNNAKPHTEEHSPPICGKTKIFNSNEDNMGFTTCISQTLKAVTLPHTEEHSPPVADKTKIFNSNEEHMEFTTCINQNQTMKDATSITIHTEEQSPPMADKTKIFNSNEQHMEFTACITDTMKSVTVAQVTKANSTTIADQTKIFEEDNMEFTTCFAQEKSGESTTDNVKEGIISKTPETIGVNQDDEDTEVILAKSILPENTNNKMDLLNKQAIECTSDTEGIVKSRKRSHPNMDAEVYADRLQDQASDSKSNVMTPNEITESINMISEETEPKLPDSPVREQEVTTGLKGLMSKVKKARKSIGHGETASIFNDDVPLAQMDLTTCTGGIDSRENTAKILSLKERQSRVRYF